MSMNIDEFLNSHLESLKSSDNKDLKNLLTNPYDLIKNYHNWLIDNFDIKPKN